MAGTCLTGARPRSRRQKPTDPPGREDDRPDSRWPRTARRRARPRAAREDAEPDARGRPDPPTSDSQRRTRTRRSNGAYPPRRRPTARTGLTRPRRRTHRSNGACRPPTREVATPCSVRHRSSNRCCHRNGWSHPRNPATPQTHWMSCEGIPHRTACRSLTIPLDRVSLPRSEPLPPYFTGAPSAPNRATSISPDPRQTTRSPTPGQESRGQATQESEKGRPNGATLFERMSGSVLLSHKVPLAVPSALRSLASGFGMGPGVSLSL